MALTATSVFQIVVGDRRMHVVDVTGDSSYVGSGGESLTKAMLGFASTEDPEFHVIVEASGGYVGQYNITDSKLAVYWVDTSVDGAAMAEATGADLSLVIFRVTAFGRFQL